MRILYLTQFFEPEPAFKGLPFARALAESGHTVRVITGFPNYPGGKLYPGYRLRWLQRERHDGIKVDRVYLYPSHDRSAVRRILNYVSFGIRAGLRAVRKARSADVVYAYHPPLTTALAAGLAGRLWRRPVVIDIQDLWPDTLEASGMLRSKSLLSVVDKVCRLTYRLASHIIVQSPGFRQRLLDRGVPDHKISIVMNWAADEQLRPNPAADLSAFGLTGRFNVLFAGTLGRAQALDVVLDAAKVLIERTPRVRFVIVGGGTEAERLQARITAEAISNVDMFPFMPRARVFDLQAQCDALLVNLAPDPLFEITIPSKTQVCLAAGRPIVMAVAGDAADIVHAAQAGVVVPPGDPEALARGISQLAAMTPQERDTLGQSGAAYYRDNLSFAIAIGRTNGILEDLNRPHATAPRSRLYGPGRKA